MAVNMKIQLKNVSVDIPVFNSQGRSLKKTVMGIATGGKIGLTEAGKTVIRSLDNINLEISSHERSGLNWAQRCREEYLA